MPIPLINSIASWLLKKRMHQIELFIKYPNEVQNDILLNLINSAKDTFIGKKYNFNSIKNYDKNHQIISFTASSRDPRSNVFKFGYLYNFVI